MHRESVRKRFVHSLHRKLICVDWNKGKLVTVVLTFKSECLARLPYVSEYEKPLRNILARQKEQPDVQ